MKKIKISALMASLLMVSGVAYADAEFSFSTEQYTEVELRDITVDVTGTVDLDIDNFDGLNIDLNVTDLQFGYSNSYLYEEISKSSSIDFEGDVVNAAVNTGNIDASINFTGAAIGSNAINVSAISDQFNTTIVTTSALNGMDNSTTNSTLSNTSSVTADSADLAELRTVLSTEVIGAINQAETTIANDDHGYSGWGRWGSWRDNHGDLEIVNVAYNNGDILASVNIAAGGLTETITTVPGAEGNVDAEIATIVPTTVMGVTVSTSVIGAANISTINVSR